MYSIVGGREGLQVQVLMSPILQQKMKSLAIGAGREIGQRNGPEIKYEKFSHV